MAVTTKDLARICGVSRATVNRALHDLGGISEETKKKILQTADELGYQPDLVARTMVRGKSMTVGVIVVDLRNQYFAEMINAMEKKAKEYGYILNITLHEQDKETEMKLVQTLVGHRIDGLIISPAQATKEFQQYLKKLPIPVVLIGCKATEDVASVGIDDFQAARDAVHYIAAHKYQKLSFVVPPLEDDHTGLGGHEERLRGFQAGAADVNLPYEIIKGRFYCEKALELLSKNEERTAFLCSGDKFARDIIFYCMKEKIYAGKDYGIMSFDKIDFYQYMEPGLSCVDNHINELGTTSVQLLMGMIREEEEVQNITIPHDIIPGETL